MPTVDAAKEVDIKVINADSQEGKMENAYRYMERIVPIIDSIKPNWGYITDDTKYINIYGSNFKLGAKVYIGGVESTDVNSHDHNYLYVKVPVSDKPATVDVKVVNPGGKEAVLKEEFVYKNLPSPQIEYISPNEGVYNQEKTITIYGKWFQKGAKVKIGDKEALKTTIYDNISTYIKVKVPVADAPKMVDIKVVNPDGKEVVLKGGFTYKDTLAPQIRCYSAYISGGQLKLAVYAYHLSKNMAIRIESTGEEIVNSEVYSTYVNFDLPSIYKGQKVKIILINKDENKESAPYEVQLGEDTPVPQMTISYLSPDHGKLEGGYSVGIYGNNFAKDSEVYVDGRKVENIYWGTSTYIGINKMPARLIDGQVNIEVRNVSLGQSKTIKFTYDPKPIIPAPQIRCYSAYTSRGQLCLDVYAYYLSKNMAIRIESTGEEILNSETYSTYATFKLLSTYKGQKVKIILINKDENKESVPYEVQF